MIGPEAADMDNEDRARYEWLALRCQAGDPGAFEDLVAVMERPLLYYATSLTGNRDDGLDVLQDVWIKVLRRIGQLKEPSALRAWLYSITHGVAIDRIRRERTREKAEEAEFAEFQEAEEPSFAEEDAAAIHEAMNAGCWLLVARRGETIIAANLKHIER